MGCKRAFCGITKSGTQDRLPDHKKGCLFLIFDLNEKIKVQSVSGIYGHHLEPQCRKWCILPLNYKETINNPVDEATCYSLLVPLQRGISLGLSNQIIKRSIGEDSEVNHSSPTISCVPQLILPGVHLNKR